MTRWLNFAKGCTFGPMCSKCGHCFCRHVPDPLHTMNPQTRRMWEPCVDCTCIDFDLPPHFRKEGEHGPPTPA